MIHARLGSELEIRCWAYIGLHPILVFRMSPAWLDTVECPLAQLPVRISG